MQGDSHRTSDDVLARKPVYHDVIRQSHQEEAGPTKRPHQPKKRHALRWVVIVVLVACILGGGVTYYFVEKTKNSNTLPYPISTQTVGLLGFDIYYPNQKLLPSGYTLDRGSFTYSDQAIVYTVSYGNNQKIIFSDQAKPALTAIQTFTTDKLPLHTTLSTSVGTATIGGIGTQSVVSLPTKTNAWLLITAPGNINQQALTQVVKSIELAK